MHHADLQARRQEQLAFGEGPRCENAGNVAGWTALDRRGGRNGEHGSDGAAQYRWQPACEVVMNTRDSCAALCLFIHMPARSRALADRRRRRSFHK